MEMVKKQTSTLWSVVVAVMSEKSEKTVALSFLQMA